MNECNTSFLSFTIEGDLSMASFEDHLKHYFCISSGENLDE